MKIAQNLTSLIGNTPLLQLTKYCEQTDIQAAILAKLEGFNPGGSAKDRPALHMIEDARKKELLKEGGTIIEPTSGNMGIGMSWIATALGYHMIVVMPDSMSEERKKLVAAYGAQLELTPGKDGMKGAIARAEALNKEIQNSVILGQFDNPMNPDAHINTTAEEIWNDTDGTVDVFVAGIGTGGTISGTGKGLKQHNPNIKIIGVEPASSPLLTKGYAGNHGLQGIGANFIPKTYYEEFVDEVIAIEDNEAILTARNIAATEGLLVGISSGAAIAAAKKIASRPEMKGKKIVALCPDSGERYLSTCEFDTKNYPL